MGIQSHKPESTDSEECKHYEHAPTGHTNDVDDLNALGYKSELHRNRSMFTLLFQSLAIAAVICLTQLMHPALNTDVC